MRSARGAPTAAEMRIIGGVNGTTEGSHQHAQGLSSPKNNYSLPPNTRKNETVAPF